MAKAPSPFLLPISSDPSFLFCQFSLPPGQKGRNEEEAKTSSSFFLCSSFRCVTFRPPPSPPPLSSSSSSSSLSRVSGRGRRRSYTSVPSPRGFVLSLPSTTRRRREGIINNLPLPFPPFLPLCYLSPSFAFSPHEFKRFLPLSAAEAAAKQNKLLRNCTVRTARNRMFRLLPLFLRSVSDPSCMNSGCRPHFRERSNLGGENYSQ